MNLHGLLLVDKPKGITSHDLVYKARRLLKIDSVGHCGTLDPIATGLMVLLLGEATKMSQFILERDKSYLVDLKFGIRTDTLDLTGKVLSETQVSLERDAISKLAAELTGELELSVPKFSAVKQDGKKLYEMARKGEEVEVPRRFMNFKSVKPIQIESDWARFEIHCSKGSFIRAWVSEMGERLSCGATMTELRRLSSEPYHLEDAISLEKITDPAEVSNSSAFIPLIRTLPEVKTLRVTDMSEKLMRNGQISHDLKRQLISVYRPEVDSLVKILSSRSDEILALVGNEKGKGFVIKRVFRY